MFSNFLNGNRPKKLDRLGCRPKKNGLGEIKTQGGYLNEKIILLIKRRNLKWECV